MTCPECDSHGWPELGPDTKIAYDKVEITWICPMCGYTEEQTYN